MNSACMKSSYIQSMWFLCGVTPPANHHPQIWLVILKVLQKIRCATTLVLPPLKMCDLTNKFGQNSAFELLLACSENLDLPSLFSFHRVPSLNLVSSGCIWVKKKIPIVLITFKMLALLNHVHIEYSHLPGASSFQRTRHWQAMDLDRTWGELIMEVLYLNAEIALG